MRNLKHSWLAWERWVFAARTTAEGGGGDDGRRWRRQGREAVGVFMEVFMLSQNKVLQRFVEQIVDDSCKV